MPDTLPHLLYTKSYLILRLPIMRWWFLLVKYTCQETEAYRGEIIC